MSGGAEFYYFFAGPLNICVHHERANVISPATVSTCKNVMTLQMEQLANY